VSKKKAKRTALRRRNRADRAPVTDSRAPDQGRILGALNAARAPLSADELAARLRVGRQARREFDRALSALERAGEIVQNRTGALLVAKRIAVVAGRV
jgi:ribonuclease R